MLNGLETAANVDGVPGPREHAYIRRSKIKPINLALPSTPFMRSCSSLHNGFYYVTDRNIDLRGCVQTPGESVAFFQFFRSTLQSIFRVSIMCSIDISYKYLNIM